MITVEQIKTAEATGQYQFSFVIDSTIGIAVRDDNYSFEDYCKDPENWLAIEHMGKRHKYSLEQMKDFWQCILIQRKAFKAISMVVSGKHRGINQGLRELGIF